MQNIFYRKSVGARQVSGQFGWQNRWALERPRLGWVGWWTDLENGDRARLQSSECLSVTSLSVDPTEWDKLRTDGTTFSGHDKHLLA